MFTEIPCAEDAEGEAEACMPCAPMEDAAAADAMMIDRCDDVHVLH